MRSTKVDYEYVIEAVADAYLRKEDVAPIAVLSAMVTLFEKRAQGLQISDAFELPTATLLEGNPVIQ